MAGTWRGLLLVSVCAAVLLIVLEVAVCLLVELALGPSDRTALRVRFVWPLLYGVAVLIAFATVAAIRIAQLKPRRVHFRVRDHMWFALACATLVLLPSAALLERWVGVAAMGHGYLLIQLVEMLSMALTGTLLLRGAREAWYAG